MLKLGIIGGGQLGMYLCQSARKLGIQSTILVAEADVSAVHFADEVIVGEMTDSAVVDRFLNASDVVTFEFEDVPNETLHQLAIAEQDGRVSVNPSLHTLFLLKDKGLQKAWLAQNDFPTLPHRLVQGTDLNLYELTRELGLPLVQKARCGGYDGRGVQIIRTQQQLQDLWDTPSILERYLGERKEISVVTARSADGQVSSYPPVSMEFDPEFNALHLVSTPADCHPDLAQRATALAEAVVDRLEGVGVFAVEMFVSPAGEVLVNEISPRVHNSGHLTLEACDTSQFDQHVRAVAGLPLEPINEVSPAAMVNVLYKDALGESCPSQPTADRREDAPVTIHWYGKETGRRGRKMGHITALGSSAATASAEASKALAGLSDPSNNAAA